MPKVSVIVPVYKTAKYLRKCIDSILNQTFQDFEIILVSDGPEEDDKICEEYVRKDNRISLIKNVNRGLGGARNAALEIAKGEYISFVDSDDWIESETFTQALKNFNKDTDLVIFGTNIVGDKRNLPRGLKPYLKLKYDGLQERDDELLFNTNVHAWNKIYKKSIINKYKIRFPENMQYEDFPFHFLYLLVANKIFYLNTNLYNYNQRLDSEMYRTYVNNDYECVKDHLVGCKFLFNELHKNYLFFENKYLFSRIYSEWIKVGLNYCNKRDKLRYIKLAYEYFNEMNLETFDFFNLKLLKEERFKDLTTNLISEKILYLFGLIPFMKIKDYGYKIKFYLLGISAMKMRRK